jgi:hypothetical protein
LDLAHLHKLFEFYPMQDDKTESTGSDLEMNGANGFCRIDGRPDDVNGAASELRQRIREMEEDQEELNNSLMALTSHFAKVTFLLQK